MKSIRAAATILIFLFCATAPAFSGSWHSGSTLVCSECHTMHYSEGGVSPPPGADAGGPFDRMLLKTNINNLCLTCHDGAAGTNAAPDVMTTAGADHANLRAAGAFRAAVTTATASAHNLGVATDGGTVPPGGSGAWTVPTGGLTCANCHEPHGTVSYRNLVLDPGGVSVPAVTNVTETFTNPTATQYDVTNITYTGDTFSRWCRGCHSNFHINPYAASFTNDANLAGSDAGDTSGGASDQWKRHPGSHVTMAEGNTNAHVDSTYWLTTALSRTPVIDPTSDGATGDDMVFCGSCHKAHGSDVDKGSAVGYARNLIYDDSTTPLRQDGTTLTQLCQICHNQ